MQNVLFICSRNQWRSPTAESIWRKHPEINVRSAGTSRQARRTVTLTDIRWADIILVMEEKHFAQLQVKFTRAIEYKAIVVLDIPDEYRYMEPELIDELTESVATILSLDCEDESTHGR